jgi:hypothetical protein
MPEPYQSQELRKHTKQFAIRIVKMYRALPETRKREH